MSSMAFLTRVKASNLTYALSGGLIGLLGTSVAPTLDEARHVFYDSRLLQALGCRLKPVSGGFHAQVKYGCCPEILIQQLE